jgi:hypothetical protein
MDSRSEKAIIQSVMGKLYDLGREMKDHLQFVEVPVDTGDLKEDVYASIDDVTGVIEIGYDESNRERPHGFYNEFGTSQMPANPAIRRTVYRRYRDR